MAKTGSLNTPYTESACPTPKPFHAVTEAKPFENGPAPTPDPLGGFEQIKLGQGPGKVDFKAIPGSQK